MSASVHGDRTARKVVGLEAALLDNRKMKIGAIEPEDARTFEVAVAGQAALLVAKLHKIAEREGKPGRIQDKDALDALRLLRIAETAALSESFQHLFTVKVSETVSRQAVGFLERLFARPESAGSRMALARPSLWKARRPPRPRAPR